MPEVHLRAAAGDIDRMPSAEVQESLRKLKERRAARSQMEILHQQSEVASVEQEQAPYQLARQAEEEGDLPRAAHWYMAAALNDFGDASLRLARILDALAERHLVAQGADQPSREELDLVSEACRWYSDALVAGEADAQELLENLIDRHLGKSRTAALKEKPEKSAILPSDKTQQLFPFSTPDDSLRWQAVSH